MVDNRSFYGIDKGFGVVIALRFAIVSAQGLDFISEQGAKGALYG